MKIVNVVYFSWPNLASVVVLIFEMTLQKNIHFFAKSDSLVIFNWDLYIKQRHKFKILSS